LSGRKQGRSRASERVKKSERQWLVVVAPSIVVLVRRCTTYDLVATEPGSFGTRTLARGPLIVASRSDSRRALPAFPLGRRMLP